MRASAPLSKTNFDMKNIFLGLIGFLILAAAALAFKPSSAVSLDESGLTSTDNVLAQFKEADGVRTVFADGSEYFAGNDRTFYEYTWALDTLSNANNDTLTLPSSLAISVMYSDFEYQYSIVRTSISGTANVALKIEQSNYPNNTAPGNTAWASLATGSGTGATVEYLTGDCTAMRLRYIVDGTGTQSTSYRLRAIFKKKV